MAYLADYSGPCYPGLETEIYTPRARLLPEDYPMASLEAARRAVAHRPLSDYIAGDYGIDGAYGLRRRPMLLGGDEMATIDRDGPYIHNPLLRQSRINSLLYDDPEDYNLSDACRPFAYTYPLPCMEPGGTRWGLDQIHAYNREVVRHNNLIARRRSLGAPAEHLMLHPMMDSHARFPPGFDRPTRLEDFLCSGEPLLDSYRHHYGLPAPETLERLLLLNSTERQLKRHLKQVQLLEFYGARRLAEQLSLQLLAVQNAMPGLSMPRGLGYGLGPEFDDSLPSSLMRNHASLPSNAMIPIDALGYGNGLANWNWPALSEFREPRFLCGPAGTGTGTGLGGNPWTGRPSGIYPGPLPGMSRGGMGGGLHGNWHGLPYGGGGGANGWADHGNSINRDLERISCDGGRARRSGRFN